MLFPDEFVAILSRSIASLYENLLIENVPEDAYYLGYLDQETKFGLNEEGYRTSYLGFIQHVFSLPEITEKWSYEGLNELVHYLLLKLADHKYKVLPAPDFVSLARGWLAQVDVDFQKYVCYLPVVGLSVESPIEIGEASFLPLNIDLPELKEELVQLNLKNLNSFRHCLSCSSVTAEWQKAAEVHQQRTHAALNVIRYISSLVYHDQPARHIYVAGRDLSRVSDTFVVDDRGKIGRVGRAEYTPLPLQIDANFLQYASVYGFDYILSLLNKSTPTEIEEAFLTAMQWYGEATQELLPLISFAMYYTSIETALKKEDEISAKRFLPKRISVLLEPWNKERQQKLKENLGEMIDERNAVLHSGKPRQVTPEYLAWSGKVIARQILNQLQLRLRDSGIKTKDDIIRWVDEQYAKINSDG